MATESLPIIPKISKPRLQKIKKLGEGTYGRVYQAIADGDSSEPVAVKRNFIHAILKGTIGAIRELDILTLVKSHPFIIQMKEAIFEVPFSNGSLSPETNNFVSDKTYLILEKGDLDGEHYLRTSPSPPINERKLFIIHILLALEFLHSRGIYHRDVKPANVIWFSKKSVAKLTDFGLAQPYCSQNMSMPGFVTLWYRAPEISLTKNYDYKVDVWGAGCIMFETFSPDNLRFMQPATDEELINAVMARVPFPREDYQLALQIYPGKINQSYDIMQKTQRSLAKQLGYADSQIAQFNSSQLLGKPNHGNFEQLVDLLGHMLVVNPKDRWTTSQCLNHPLFNGYRDLINEVRVQFGISSEGQWILRPEYTLKYVSCPAREKAMRWFKIIYTNRLSSPILNWYSHRILFHAIEMLDRYLQITGVTDSTDGEIVVWVNVFLFISAKYFRIILTEFGLNFFATGIITEQLNLFNQKAQSFEEHVIRDLFKYEIYSPTVFELSDTFLTECGVAHLLRIIMNEELSSGIPLNRLLIKEQDNLIKLSRTSISLSSGQTPLLSSA